MFEKTKAGLKELGADITVTEIAQQPRLWRETLNNYQANKQKIDGFLEEISKKHGTVRVILTGAGTSAYVADTVIPYLKTSVDEKVWNFMSVPTTEIVSNPYEYLNSDIPTLFVSFARSGNSPESIATVNLGKQIVKNFYQLTITCAPDGKLAQGATGDESNLVLLMPADSNDKGFAMTGSYTCMTLTTLLIFDSTPINEKENWVESCISMGEDVVVREREIEDIVALDFNRVIYLGSGSLAGMTREASLKLLELTAGKTATLFDSSLGFRHGPKSFVDENTLVFVFTSSNEYTRKYDLDILNEVYADKIAKRVCSIDVRKEESFAGATFAFDQNIQAIPDAYLALPYVMVAQTFAVMEAIKLGNKPDTPSPTGTVNRVVQGVKIHPYKG